MNSLEDIDIEEIEALSRPDGYLHKSDALYFAFEFAYEDRKLGLSPKEFLKKRMQFNCEIDLNWGLALDIYINCLLKINSTGSKSIN